MDRAAVAALTGARIVGTRRTTAAGARLRHSGRRTVIPEWSGCVSVRYIHEQTLLAAYQTTVRTGTFRFARCFAKLITRMRHSPTHQSPSQDKGEFVGSIPRGRHALDSLSITISSMDDQYIETNKNLNFEIKLASIWY